MKILSFSGVAQLTLHTAKALHHNLHHSELIRLYQKIRLQFDTRTFLSTLYGVQLVNLG